MGADAALRKAFVSVRGEAGPVGGAVLLTEDLVLTCAHVVNSALRRDRFSIAAPSRDRDEVRLVMPHVDPERPLTGRVVPEMWSPARAARSTVPTGPLPPGTIPYYGDLAVLKLDAPAPEGAAPAPFLPHRDGSKIIAFWASGNELPAVRVEPRNDAPPWIVLDVIGGEILEGHSGGPLWDCERQAVVGLVVAIRQAAGPHGARQTAYAISLPTVEAELPKLPPPSVPTSQRGAQRLLNALGKLLPTPGAVVACEQRLAAKLGRASAGLAAEPEDLLGLAMGVRRGMPELLTVVREHLAEKGGPLPEGLHELSLAARLNNPRETLTTAQRRGLNGLLAACANTDPDSLLRTTLPHAGSLPLAPSLADAVDVLEGYEPREGEPMTPLLQGVVRISAAERAAGDYPSDDLEAWVMQAARGAGISEDAVRQFKAGVTTEIAHAPAHRGEGGGSRVQIELFPVPPGQRFAFQIWVWTPEGRHEIVRTQDDEVSSEHVVEAVLEVLRTEIQDDPEPASLEFFVAPAWLRLDVDMWRSGVDEEGCMFFPGISRRVIMRSSARKKETYAGWKRRTKALDSSAPLILHQETADPMVALARLEASPETAVVILSCDSQYHGLVLRQCIQAGVHTVLWHREEHGEQIARDLLSVVEAIDHAYIPEAVRSERANAQADPECRTHRGRTLSLLHDGPDHRPQPLAPDAWVLTAPDRPR